MNHQDHNLLEKRLNPLDALYILFTTMTEPVQ